MDDVYVYVTDLPRGVHEIVMPCLDGYTVYLDSSESVSERAERYEHALRHIEKHDFEKSDVQQIEVNAHDI